MITRGILLLVSILTAQLITAQSIWPASDLAPINTIDRLSLTPQDNDALVAHTRSANAKEPNRPKRFAHPITANASAKTRGSWESVAAGRDIWRLRVTSVGAHSINLGFDDFYLPPSAMMYLYTSDGENIIGPLTMDDNDAHQEWWSPIIPSDDIIVEVQIDSDERDLLKANIATVNHDFSGFGALLSGSCNIDITCGTADGFPLIEEYRDVAQSVGMYSIGGIDLCTGALVNNTRNDCTPYFLTAFHCEVSQANAASVVVYWNYQNTTCRAPNSTASGSRGDGNRTQFNSGTSFVAGYSASDFALLKLDDVVNADYNPYYSGWDRDGEFFTNAVTIHHPNSEEKRFSADFDTLEAYAGNVFFRIESWDLGTTEGGSSGAPLFNTEKQVIGQLNGGRAACGNNDFDDFGMLKVSWEGGGTPQTRLKDWLDPDNSGQTAIGGRSCVDVVGIGIDRIELCASGNDNAFSFVVRVESGYTNGADITLTNIPASLSAQLSSNRVTKDQPVTITISDSGLADTYEGIIDVEVNDGFTKTVNNIPIRVDIGLPRAPQPSLPADGESNINFKVEFEWENTGDSYDIEISANPDFTSIVADVKDITERRYSVRGLQATTTYYWRVKSHNLCGSSEYGSVYSFQTGSVVCQIYEAQDLPQEITQEPIIIKSVINVEEDNEIADVNVRNIIGKHTWLGDLEFRLIGPDGTAVNLILLLCEQDDDFHVSFDDDSELINIDCPYNDNKTYRPKDKLSVFDGMSSKGAWTLELTDEILQDGGSFDGWSLDLCIIEGKRATTAAVSPSSISICPKTFESADIDVSLSGEWGSETTVSLIDNANDAVLSTTTVGAVTSATVPLDYNALSADSRSITVRIDDGTHQISKTIDVKVVEENLQTSLSDPADMSMGIELSPTLSWSTGSGSKMMTVELYDSTATTLIWDTLVNADIESVPVPIKLDELTTYSWQVKADGECTPTFKTDQYSFTTKMTTSVNDFGAERLMVYPNPVGDLLTIAYRGSWSPQATITISDLTGNTLVQRGIRTSTEQIDVSILATGLYIYRITDGSRAMIDRLVVVH